MVLLWNSLRTKNSLIVNQAKEEVIIAVIVARSFTRQDCSTMLEVCRGLFLPAHFEEHLKVMFALTNRKIIAKNYTASKKFPVSPECCPVCDLLRKIE